MACTCGHAIDEHDPEGRGPCDIEDCDCGHYEADEEDDE